MAYDYHLQYMSSELLIVSYVDLDLVLLIPDLSRVPGSGVYVKC